jgi:hypothetical protein
VFLRLLSAAEPVRDANDLMADSEETLKTRNEFASRLGSGRITERRVGTDDARPPLSSLEPE